MNKKLMATCLALIGVLTSTSNARAEYTDDCITLSSAVTFTLATVGNRQHWDGTLWTSINQKDWTVWNGSPVTAGQTGEAYNLYVRGDSANTKITGDNNMQSWILSGTAGIACTGNIETLRGATGNEPSKTPMAMFCYSCMFYECELLTTAPDLPATTLADCCYWNMFAACKALTNAPALPAMSLEYGCYSEMFSQCPLLTKAPDLPATTLAKSCYANMFQNCVLLTKAPDLPATTLADSCYYSMFSGCVSLTKAPDLPATTLAKSCYRYMFCDCWSLTSIADLPATTLAEYCYCYMFYNCSSLAVNGAPPGKVWKIPATEAKYKWNDWMFMGSAGTVGMPNLNTTYYIASAEKPIEPGGTTEYKPEGWTKPIAVSNDWLIAKGLVKPGDSATEAQVKLTETGANGLKRYESYILGMEPDSVEPAEEQLKVTIEGFDNEGLPIIKYSPKPNDAARVKYMTLGKSELKAVDWVEVTDLNKYLMRFYRTKAEIVP